MNRRNRKRKILDFVSMIVVAASLMIMLYSIKANSRTIPVISDIDFPTATAQVFIATEYIKAGSLILGVSSTPFNVPPNAAGNDGRIWTYVDASGSNELLQLAGGKSYRGNTIIIAAANSIDPASADFICSGTHDQQQFAAAFDVLKVTGGTVLLLDGGYVPSRVISVTYDNITIKGQGTRATTIHRGFTSLSSREGVINVGDRSGFTLMNLAIDGHRINYPGAFNDGLVIDQAFKDHVENVEIYNCGLAGLFVKRTGPDQETYTSIINLNLHDNTGSGLELEAGDGTKITGCYFHNNSANGFKSNNAADRITISDCEAYDNGVDGFRMFGTLWAVNGCVSASNTVYGFSTSLEDSVVGDCVARVNLSHGFYVQGASNQYNNLLSSDNFSAGIALKNSAKKIGITGGRFSGNDRGYGTEGLNADVLISGNIFRKNDQEGVRINTSSFHTVIGNTFELNGTTGISVTNSSDCYLLSNMFFDNDGYEISIELASTDLYITGNIIQEDVNDGNQVGIELDNSGGNQAANIVLISNQYINQTTDVELNAGQTLEADRYLETINGVFVVSSSSAVSFSASVFAGLTSSSGVDSVTAFYSGGIDAATANIPIIVALGTSTFATAFFDRIGIGTPAAHAPGQFALQLSPFTHAMITGGSRQMELGILRITGEAGRPNTHGILVRMDSSSQSDTHLISGDLVATGLVTGEIAHGFDLNIDASNADGGDIQGFAVTVVGLGEKVNVDAIFTGVDVNVIHQDTGVFDTLEQAFKHDGSFTDTTAGFNSSATNIELFSSNNHYVYVGNSAQFSELSIQLESASSKDIESVFEFSAGGSSWTTFGPTDPTIGFQESGVLNWESSGLIGWTTDTVNSVSNKYWIRIQRTNNQGLSPPVEDRIKLSVVSEHTWDKDGNLIINSIAVTAGIDGASANISGLLHVGAGTDASDITATDLLVTRAGPSSLSARDSTNNVEIFLFASSVGGVMGTVTNDPLDIKTNNTSAIFIDAAGRVGVATTVPAAPFAVVGDSLLNGSVEINDGKLVVSSGQSGATADAGADDLVIENSSTGGISILAPDGSVSILRFGSPTDNTGALVEWQYSTLNMDIATSAAGGNLVFYSDNAVKRMTIAASGDIGMLTDGQTTTLEVNGIVAADSFFTISESGAKNDLGPPDVLSLRQNVRVMAPRKFTRKIKWEYRDKKTLLNFRNILSATKIVATADIFNPTRIIGGKVIETIEQQLIKYNQKRAELLVHKNYTQPRYGIYLDDPTTPNAIKSVDKNGREWLDHGMSIGYLLAIVHDQQIQLDDQQTQIDDLIQRMQALEAAP